MLKEILLGDPHDAADQPPDRSLDDLLEWADRHHARLPARIEAAPESSPRTPFATTLPRSRISAFNFTARQRLRVLPRALPLFVDLWRGVRMGRRRPTRSEADPRLFAALEARARAAGARDLRYVKVPRTAIFRGKSIPCDTAIVYTVEMAKAPIESAPSFDCMLEVMGGYRRLAAIGNRLARLLNRRGFAAYPGTALGGVTDYPHLAELAGLGAIGYHGLLITPGEGARLRIGVVYTNITNLPAQPENEHLWVRDFCAMCHRCVRKCPVQAIYPEPRPRADGGMQCIEHGTCRDYFSSNYGCAVCLAVCPFSHMGYEKVKAGFRGKPGAPRLRLPQIA